MSTACRQLDVLDDTAGGAARRGDVAYVHSHEAASGLDGPGLRYVLWTTGCLMRCQYCHNPDTWRLGNGELKTFDNVLADIKRYAPFLKAAGGGVTLSGGEPLAQAPFAVRLMQTCKHQLGLHTALDTNGYLGDRITDAQLHDVDLFLLDIKSHTPDLHKRVTGVDVEPILAFANRLSDLGRPAWVRFVLVPGLTDDPANLAGLATFVAGLKNVERVEVLPFHQMGRHKWQQLGVEYPLDQTPACTQEQAHAVRSLFAGYGLPVQR
ncbi:MAG: pyruvate formate-lyase-activating protein [Phycisphaerae bacterium]